jgi:hypothetical protein
MLHRDFTWPWSQYHFTHHRPRQHWFQRHMMMAQSCHYPLDVLLSFMQPVLGQRPHSSRRPVRGWGYYVLPDVPLRFNMLHNGLLCFVVRSANARGGSSQCWGGVPPAAADQAEAKARGGSSQCWGGVPPAPADQAEARFTTFYYVLPCVLQRFTMFYYVLLRFTMRFAHASCQTYSRT